jgi:hypothetical protein
MIDRILHDYSNKVKKKDNDYMVYCLTRPFMFVIRILQRMKKKKNDNSM